MVCMKFASDYEEMWEQEGFEYRIMNKECPMSKCNLVASCLRGNEPRLTVAGLGCMVSLNSDFWSLLLISNFLAVLSL